ncbi:MAG: nucleotide sugar dehydrogenase [Candidatus Altiarchaeota archaeon]
MADKKIVVVGMGYVGIPVAALLADVPGYDVTGVQRKSKRSGWKIDKLNAGQSPIEGDEPGLSELIARVVKAGKFRVTDDVEVYREADVILIDVQTPTDETHKPRYESLRHVAADIGKRLSKDKKTLVVIESTVAPGTTENIVKPILEKESGLACGKGFLLAFSFERVMPGKLIEHLQFMPRVVGGVTSEATEDAVRLYEKIVKKPVHPTDCLTAEVTKVMENTYRDVNIAFANEMALACEGFGVNVNDVRKFMNERSDRDFHKAGAGVGGHCLVKDPYLLQYGLDEYGVKKRKLEFVTLSRKINDHMPAHMHELLAEGLKEAGKKVSSARIAVLGAAYLKDSDDIRNTPSVPLVKALLASGASVVIHDPHVRKEEFFDEFSLSGADFTDDFSKALSGADALAIVTEHKGYFDLTSEYLAGLVGKPCVIVDGRNVLARQDFSGEGFVYKGVGKG